MLPCPPSRPSTPPCLPARCAVVPSILSVPEEGEVVVCGTLYKEMGLKPSILDEYVKDRALAAQLGRARFTQPDDRCGAG